MKKILPVILLMAILVGIRFVAADNELANGEFNGSVDGGWDGAEFVYYIPDGWKAEVMPFTPPDEATEGSPECGVKLSNGENYIEIYAAHSRRYAPQREEYVDISVKSDRNEEITAEYWVYDDNKVKLWVPYFEEPCSGFLILTADMELEFCKENAEDIENIIKSIHGTRKED